MNFLYKISYKHYHIHDSQGKLKDIQYLNPLLNPLSQNAKITIFLIQKIFCS